jgi:hypothetical protein
MCQSFLGLEIFATFAGNDPACLDTLTETHGARKREARARRYHLRDGNNDDAGSGLLTMSRSTKLDFSRATPGSRDSCSL